MSLDNKLKSEIEDKLKEIIVQQLKCLDIKYDSIKLDSNFHDLGADDIDLMEMRMAVEEEYKIFITDEEAQKILTVGQAVDYISEHYKP
ncbi:acyl carrier protein [Candidatus Pacearchaeota archaeon]|nr:acyl carrier protein [Candidatus Pacearchaeota archaeon]